MASTPIILSENTLVGRTLDFVLALVKYRQRALSWSERGYLGRFAGLLREGEARGEILRCMERDWRLWKLIEPLQGAGWKKYRARSCFQRLVVWKVFKLAEQRKFQVVDDEFLVELKGMFYTTGQTTIDENGFQVERHEESKSSNRTMSDERRWSALFLFEISKTRFGFDEVPGWRDQTLDPGQNQRSLKNMCRCAVAQSSPVLRAILQGGQTPSWHSPPPQRECVYDSDFDAARVLERHGRWASHGKVWLGMFLPGRRMIVQNPEVYGDAWFLPLGDSGHPSKLSWPVQRVQHEDSVYWRLVDNPAAKQCPFLHVFDLNQWLAAEIKWEGPLAIINRHRRSSGRVSTMAYQTSSPQPLVEFAAAHAFYDFGRSALAAVAGELMCELDPGDSLMAMVQKFVLHVLGDFG